MEIKPAEFSDLKTILNLRKTCFYEVAKRYNDFSLPVLSHTIEDIEKEYSEVTILKAVEDDEIIGSIKAYEKNNVCYFGSLSVHPNFRNKGIGTKLIKAVEKKFCDCDEIEIYTGSRDEKNIYLYKKLGYKLFDKQGNKDETTVYLKKTL